MLVQAKVQLFISCLNCPEGSWRVDQLPISQTATWACGKCRRCANIKRISEDQFQIISVERAMDEPITVTLRSVTEPPITLKLNTWKYFIGQKESQEEYEDNQRYYYNMHTCPINWIHEIKEIECEGDCDPHGIFQFVSVENGHYIDPTDMSYDTMLKRQARDAQNQTKS